MIALACPAIAAPTVYDSVTTAQLRADGVTGEVEVNQLLDNRGDVLEFEQPITGINLKDRSRLWGGRITDFSPPITFFGTIFDDVTLDRDLWLEHTLSDYLFTENALTVNSLLTVSNLGMLIAKNTQTYGGSGTIQVGSAASPHPPSTGISQIANSTLVQPPILSPVGSIDFLFH